jgi:Lar family restriction alleviation protein
MENTEIKTGEAGMETKPCPWCGKTANIGFGTGVVLGSQVVYFHCATCLVRGPVIRVKDGDDDAHLRAAAAELWNNRPTTSVTAGFAGTPR